VSAETAPDGAFPDARRAFFAWRGYVKQRESTDLDALEHPLVREAFTAGYSRGVRDRLALDAVVGGALTTINRFSDLLEMLARERDAVQLVGSEEEEQALA
jgi:hypothetical protein